MKVVINKGECFQLGEVWQTPRGTLYRVVGFDLNLGKPRQAILRLGINGTGRKVWRDWDAVSGWMIHQAAQ